ncbi:hypothetical protein JCM8097_008371 [Rhodosporidiobolus ruineniae]
MVRVRNPFRRQDSFHATTTGASSTSASAAPQVSPALGDGPNDVELATPAEEKDAALFDGASGHKDGKEDEVSDPALLDAADLKAKDLLANGKERPIESAEDWSTRLLSTVDVDVPIHTFRMYVLGLGMTCFAAVLGQIFYFRPSSLTVSSLFIVVITMILGKLWEILLPKASRGAFWAFLNPGEFNIKEHVAVLIMSSTAFSSAMAISVFAADQLYYDLSPNYGLAIFTLIGSQFLGYGIAGLFRSIVVFSTMAFWPALIPNVQLFDMLHRDKNYLMQKKRLKFFVAVAVAIFACEFFPEWISPTLTGVSIVCLASRNSEWVTRIFGGAYPNEGFGLFQICLDWTYITGYGVFYTPISTAMSLYAGLALCMVVTSGAWVQNLWNAQSFPFFSQDLYYENGTLYDQTTILDADYNLNSTALEEQGLPWYTTSCVFLWHWKEIKEAFQAFRTRSINDPHYEKMKRYKEVPSWVYGAIVLGSFAMAMATCYTGDSHLPWYGVIVAFLIAFVLFPFLALFPAITGWQVDASTLCLMLGSAVVPGNSQANMSFTLYSSNASSQGIALAQDLKMAQYIKLPPRTTLWVQSLGTVIGGIIQIVLMKTLIASHREILLDPQGNNIWSGQNVQSFNSQAITWGALAKHMYAPGKTYQWVPFSILIGLLVPIPTWLIHQKFPKLRMNTFITPLFVYGLGFLNAGINSQNTMAVALTIFSQYYLRKYRATWFRKYNFILSAALDAGVQFFVFITTFALQGGAGNSTPTMPYWALNPNRSYPDYCYSPDDAAA